MASSTARPFGTATAEPVQMVNSAARAGIPWYTWCAALAITSVAIGAHWDISWHRSIGRDSFWTPAHMAIYLCGVLAGVAFGFLILHTTFSKASPLKSASVNIWGFRAPLGAFIASWGGIAMLTSAPFDNWWHDAYGLDVKIVSPPHILLFIGIYAVAIGTLVLVAAQMNRAAGQAKRAPQRLFLYVCGIMLTMVMVILMEVADRSALHSAFPYIMFALLPPSVLTLSSRTTGSRFAATFVAGFYTLFNIGLILLLPLFPAEPKLGPVYQHVTQFIPPEFPILFMVPAFALDLLWQRTKHWNPWQVALISGLVWAVLLIAVEWPFASFLMSPLARNRFFGTMYFSFGLPPSNTWVANHLFYPSPDAVAFWRGMLIALASAVLSIRWGLSRGEWLRKIKR